MAYTHDITEDDPIIAGATQLLSFTIFTDETTDAQIAAGTGTCVDVSAWTFRWRLRWKNSATNLVEKTGTISVSGVFNASQSLNTQRVLVPIAAADTTSIAAGKYIHGLWRTNGGSETPLTTGSALVVVVP